MIIRINPYNEQTATHHTDLLKQFHVVTASLNHLCNQFEPSLKNIYFCEVTFY